MSCTAHGVGGAPVFSSFQAEDGIRDYKVTGVQTCALPIYFFSSSPGPLSMSHADLDNPDHCNDCHTGGRNLSNDKCLGCHDHADMKASIDGGHGFQDRKSVV